MPALARAERLRVLCRRGVVTEASSTGLMLRQGTMRREERQSAGGIRLARLGGINKVMREGYAAAVRLVSTAETVASHRPCHTAHAAASTGVRIDEYKQWD